MKKPKAPHFARSVQVKHIGSAESRVEASRVVAEAERAYPYVPPKARGIILSVDWDDKSISPCKKCGEPFGIGDWPFCASESPGGHRHVPAASAQGFAPVVVHRDAKGNLRFPVHGDVPVPKGYQKVELRTVREVRKLEREVNLQERIKHEQLKVGEERFFGEVRSQLRGDLREAMQRMSPQGRDFARFAMEYNDSRPREKFDANFHVHAFSFDQGNK